jgi:putative glutamine amidotransferase
MSVATTGLRDNGTMPAPIIGLSTYLTPGRISDYESDVAGLPAQYMEAVTRSGGIAVFLPPQDATAERAELVISRIDGLIIAGGEDVNPERYGQPRGVHTQEPHQTRDHWEDLLMGAALKARLPLLGICRGAQLLNVHLGGTLHQHLPDVVGHNRYQVGDGLFHPEEVTLEPGSAVARIFGSTTTLGLAFHHQGIDTVAPGLTVTGRGFDGVVQALEIDAHPFGLAVQWHPEENLEDLRLFQALVGAATT